MKKFKDELESEKNPWIKRIGNYLLSREDMHNNLQKENKTLKECFTYILNELAKKAVRDKGVGYAAGDDEELFALAVHYYDEDDITIEKMSFRTNGNGSLIMQDLQKKLSSEKVEKEEQEPKEVIDQVTKKKRKSLKRERVDGNQLSIFDYDL